MPHDRQGTECSKLLRSWTCVVTTALRTGLADQIVPGARATFEAAVVRYARLLADRPDYPNQLADKRSRRATDERLRPLQDYRQAELDRMRTDIFDNANNFTAARRAFINKRLHRPAAVSA